MESQPLAYIPQKTKERVFPGGSSSYMDPDVVEISPPINGSLKSSSKSRSSRSLKQKEVIHHEVIDVDMDDDCGDVLFLGGKVDTNSKGKEAMVNFSSKPSGAAKLGSMDGVDSLATSSALGLDSFTSDFSYSDDYMDIYHDDFIFDDDYTILQSHFDNIDIPSGVEAPIPWLPGPAQRSMPAIEPAQLSRKSSSALQSKMDPVLPYPGVLSEFAQSKKNVAGSSIPTYSSSQAQRGDVNIQSTPKLSRSSRQSESSHGKWKSIVSTSSSSSHEQHGGMQLYPSLPHISASNYSNSKKKQVGSTSPYSTPHFPMVSPNPPHFPMVPPNPPPFPMVTPNLPLGGSTHSRSKYDRSMHKHNLGNSAPSYLGAVNPFPAVHDSWFNDLGKTQKSAANVRNSRGTPVSSSNFHKYGDEEEILKKFQAFKKFDTVEDHSDHHYVGSVYSVKQPTKNWAKKIQDEWRILEKDLPDTIFVRVYESRMDLLRAVIVGAEGTPYHDGLFFFDVHFPSSYPSVPPHVYYHSGGLRINPNLYNEGKVCLSLLNTWSGGQKEKWLPGVSTMLQVLVSIQGLILNAKPYFNEPGYANSSGSVNGEKCSLQYNEDTFIKSLTTMVYSIRRPPKHFEDLVAGHFLTRAHDILVACKAYKDGAQVGCLVRGGVQDVDEGDKSCSQAFKQTLSAKMVMVIEAFKHVGAKDCDKFLPAAQS